jgi:hypothetical protein
MIAAPKPAARHSADHDVAVERLKAAADAYVAAFGEKEGLENMAEDFCRFVAEVRYPAGWAGMVQYIMKAAG